MAGFQLRVRLSERTISVLNRDLHQRDRPCFTTVIPARKRATKQRTIKSEALVHPVAGLNVGRKRGMRELEERDLGDNPGRMGSVVDGCLGGIMSSSVGGGGGCC